MKAQDLRLGNFVIAKNEIIKIIEFRESFVLGENDNRIIGDLPSKMKPIELTEDMLVKIGFRVDCISINITLYKYESMLLNGKVGMEYFLYTNGNSILDCKFFNNCDSFNNCNSIFKNNIKYLHQLQNTYFLLTNQELDVKLRI